MILKKSEDDTSVSYFISYFKMHLFLEIVFKHYCKLSSRSWNTVVLILFSSQIKLILSNYSFKTTNISIFYACSTLQDFLKFENSSQSYKQTNYIYRKKNGGKGQFF